MRLLWLTDLHLNFVNVDLIEELLNQIKGHNPDALLIGGDTGEAPNLAKYLTWIAGEVGVPCYFVLGNHDYYRSSIANIRQVAQELSTRQPLLHWLPSTGIVELTDSAILIGHGGWGDARSGDFLKSDILLNDYFLIEELREAVERNRGIEKGCSGLYQLRSELHALGDEVAAHFNRLLPTILQHPQPRQLLVLMHVPPFRESCWYNGQISDDNWAPHFVCMAAGVVLKFWMERYPQHQMTVLCGHTHGAGEADILPNLHISTGGAVYGAPAIQRVIDLP